MKVEKELRNKKTEPGTSKGPTIKPTFEVKHVMAQCNGPDYKFHKLLPPPTGKHRYSSHQSMVNDIHTFLKNTLIRRGSNEAGDGQGTIWLEMFTCFDVMGFNSEHNKEAYENATLDKNTTQRQNIRNQLWIEHRLKHRKGKRNG